MHLKSFGCSFVYGSELQDHGQKLPFSLPSDFCYANHLANLLGYEHINYSQPGIGNMDILRRIISQVSTQPCLFLINWTWIDRFDYCDQNDKWCSILPADDDVSATLYYKHLHSQYQDKFRSLLAISSAIDILKHSGQKFIMTYTDNLLFEHHYHTDKTIKFLQQKIRPWVSDIDGMSFYNWCKKQKFKISDNGHPLDEAHVAISKYIFDNLKNLTKE